MRFPPFHWEPIVVLIKFASAPCIFGHKWQAQPGYKAVCLSCCDLYGNGNKPSLCYRRWRWNLDGDVNSEAESCGFLFVWVIKVKTWKHVLSFLSCWNILILDWPMEMLSCFHSVLHWRCLKGSILLVNGHLKMTPGKRNQTCRKDGWHPSELGPQKTSLFNPEGLMGVSGIISDNLVLCFSRLCSVLWDYCVAFPQDPAAHWGINTYFYQPWADDDLSIFIHAFFSHRKYE